MLKARRWLASCVVLVGLVGLVGCGGSRAAKSPASPFGALPQAPPPVSSLSSRGGSAPSGEAIQRSDSAEYAPAASRNEDDGGNESIQVAQAETTGTSVSGSVPGSSGGGDKAVAVGPALPQPGEKMVVTGAIHVYVEDGTKAVESLRVWLNAHRARIVGEELRGSGRSWTGDMRVRLPPDEVRGFVKLLEETGDVSETRLQAEEVTRQYFDQELQIRALRVTLARLEKILAEKGHTTQEVLVIEREMERVRSQIESIEGEHRFLTDRIAFATIDVSLRVRGDVIFAPRAKFHPGPRLAVLFPIDAPDADAIVGGGVTLHIERELTLDLDLFPADGPRERIVIATVGGSTYSDFAGAGKNRFLNPYLGLRTGYAHTGKGSSWVLGAEVGLELFKLEWLLVEVAGRGLALIDDDGSDLAAELTFGFEVPF